MKFNTPLILLLSLPSPVPTPSVNHPKPFGLDLVSKTTFLYCVKRLLRIENSTINKSGQVEN